MKGKQPRKKRGGKRPSDEKGSASASEGGGLLGRLFRGDGKKRAKKAGKASRRAEGGKTAGRAAAASARPLSPLERSIQEIKQMSKVGKSDPERLAMMLSRILQQERQKQDQAQADFDKMVWDIVHRSEGGEDGGEGEQT